MSTFDPSDPNKLVKRESPRSDKPMINAWSLSVKQDFRRCPYILYLKKVKKLKPPPNEYSARGIEVHAKAEAFVKGEINELPAELDKFKDQFYTLRDTYNIGTVELEGEWAYDVNWQPVDWFDKAVWCRMKLDALVRQTDTCVRVIDYKTGKMFGNEMKHGEQAIDYAYGTVQRYPEIQFVDVEFWYLDTGQQTRKSFTREMLINVLGQNVTRKGLEITEAKSLPPKPGKSNCGVCGFYENGCEYGTCD